MIEGAETTGVRLNALLHESGLLGLDAAEAGRFGEYLSLILRWNARVNLTAVRNEEGILSRHFVESIACARALPAGIATMLDFGSGGGFPGIPIALCRPEIAVTLAESQGKKAAFLSEAVRVLGIASKGPFRPCGDAGQPVRLRHSAGGGSNGTGGSDGSRIGSLRWLARSDDHRQ